MEQFKLTDNQKENRFEFKIDEHTAFIEYLIGAKSIILTHTEVPKELGGKGIGSELIRQVLTEINKRDLKLKPMCSFVKQYLSKHPEMNLLAKTD